MKTLTIHGASDDLVYALGIPGGDEFGAYINGRGCYAGKLLVRSKEGTMNVHCIYDGSWAFAVTTEDGDYDELPDWELKRTWGDNCPYSETLTIEVPADATVTFVKRD